MVRSTYTPKHQSCEEDTWQGFSYEKRLHHRTSCGLMYTPNSDRSGLLPGTRARWGGTGYPTAGTCCCSNGAESEQRITLKASGTDLMVNVHATV